MSKQIFKKIVPINILHQLLEKICEYTPAFYFFNIHAYKKMLFYNYQVDFLKELLPYYHLSKRFYLEREVTYNSITTILRQICKSHEIKMISKMKYCDSNYIIEYSIPILNSLSINESVIENNDIIESKEEIDNPDSRI
jgi:hypothetical protein